MFSTCIFCNGSLEKNDVIECFPVGKRLAFDASKGRLWVVCSHCERWNLSPLEERWEAIEECERIFRDTRTRISTDNIGLARCADGTTLIRIGAAMRPEFAAWRYGDQFGRRRRRQLLLSGGGTAAFVGLLIGGPVAGLAIVSGSALVNTFNLGNIMYYRLVPRVYVHDGAGRKLALATADLRAVRFQLRGPANDVQVEFPYREWSPTGALLSAIGIRNRPNARLSEPAHLEGDVALRAMAKFLPALNGGGGNKAQVSKAVAAIEASNNSVQQLLQHAMNAPPPIYDFSNSPRTGYASALPKEFRLALEMTVHEDDERRAMEGELHVLEERWKEADEIAAIADSLLLPDAVGDRLDDLQNREKKRPTG